MALWLLAFLLLASFSQSGAVECPDDWITFQGSCYVVIDDSVQWTDAWTICKMLDARLVTIETAQENDFVTAQLKERFGTGDKGAWLGLQDFVKEGSWVLDGNQETPEYTNWAVGEPNNDYNQDCGVINMAGRWDDDICGRYHLVVCEQP